MQYLVQRWHSGKRMGSNVTVSCKRKPTENIQPAVFQLGQPVSSQNFSNSFFRNNKIKTENEPHSNTVFNQKTQYQPVPSTNNRNSGSAFEQNNPRPSSPNTSQELPPWSGYTPPSKDKRESVAQIERVGR